MHLASCTWQRCTLVQSPSLGVIRRCVCIKMQAVLRLLAKDTEASRCREKSGKHHQQSQIVDSPVSLKSRERSKGVSSSNSNRRHDQGFRNRLLTQRRVGAVPRVGRNCRHRGRADHFRHLAREIASHKRMEQEVIAAREAALAAAQAKSESLSSAYQKPHPGRCPEARVLEAHQKALRVARIVLDSCG